jgi:hypothetical protein
MRTNLEPGTPVRLFPLRIQGLATGQPINVEVASNGKRFLVNTVVDDSDNVPIDIRSWSGANVRVARCSKNAESPTIAP